jgi:hypothetical protein
MATNRLTLLTLPLAVASLALGACGGGGSDEATAGTGDQRAEFREAALKFARCMREHGIDMPDPKPGGRGGLMFGGPGTGPEDEQKMEDAQRACQKYMEAVKPPELSPEQEQKFKEQALKLARCMREHGIDFPDPQFQGDGRVTQRLNGGLDPRSPRFREAQEDCAKGMRGGGPMTIGPGPDGP